MALQTYGSSISAGGASGVNAHGVNMAARRIAPPRDRTWLIQRVRMAAVGGTYVYYSGLNGIASTDTTEGAMPTCGLWRNRISPEDEIVYVGCVPPRMTPYDPQIPVTIRSSDFVIFGVQDVSFNSTGIVVPAGKPFTVTIELDFEELPELDKDGVPIA